MKIRVKHLIGMISDMEEVQLVNKETNNEIWTGHFFDTECDFKKFGNLEVTGLDPLNNLGENENASGIAIFVDVAPLKNKSK